MITLRGFYDPDSKKLTIEFSSSFIKDHYNILKESFKESEKYFPKAPELKRTGETDCVIIISIEIQDSVESSSKFMGFSKMNLPESLTNNINIVINRFLDKSIKLELSNTEFIPLYGYPLNKLQEDIKEAIKNHRNFCLIDKYSDYLEFSRHNTMKLNQKKIEYSSDEYSNIAIDIYQGNIKALREKYMKELEEVNWG